VRLDRPRLLAESLMGLDSISGLRLVEGDSLMIETADPEKVLGCLPEIMIRRDMKVTEIAAADEDLEAVFGYLTDRGAGLRGGT